METKFPIRIPYRKIVEGDSVREQHESFGMIAISRVQGGRHLFGSEIDRHGTFFRLSISQCEVDHHLGQNWYHDRKELISIDLSPAQFAQFITSPNVGSGTPCTIDRVLMEKMDEVPREVKNESEKIQDGFKAKAASLVSFLKASRKEAGEILNGSKPPNQKERSKLLEVFDRMVREVDLNMPFAVETFVEATEKVKTTAKAEMEAAAALFLTRLGLERAREQFGALGSGEPPIIVLPAEGSKE